MANVSGYQQPLYLKIGGSYYLCESSDYRDVREVKLACNMIEVAKVIAVSTGSVSILTSLGSLLSESCSDLGSRFFKIGTAFFSTAAFLIERKIARDVDQIILRLENKYKRLNPVEISQVSPSQLTVLPSVFDSESIRDFSLDTQESV